MAAVPQRERAQLPAFASLYATFPNFRAASGGPRSPLPLLVAYWGRFEPFLGGKAALGSFLFVPCWKEAAVLRAQVVVFPAQKPWRTSIFVRSPNEVFFLPDLFQDYLLLYFFEQLTYLRIILFIFCFLTENFVFIFNYLGSDIFLLLDRTLALDLLHGSGKFTIISGNLKDLHV